MSDSLSFVVASGHSVRTKHVPFIGSEHPSIFQYVFGGVSAHPPSARHKPMRRRRLVFIFTRENICSVKLYGIIWTNLINVY